MPYILVLILILGAGRLYSQPSVTLTSKEFLDDDELLVIGNELDSSRMNKDDFVYWATTGQAFFMTHQYEASNQCFEKAYLKRLDQILEPKNGESYEELHEVFMLLYFKAINYLSLGKPADAMVECRRMNDWLRPHSSKDTGRMLMAQDPLVHSIMGLLYELNDDFSDSFISYRSADQLYGVDYENLFSKKEPEQIKRSLVLTDSLSEACQTNVLCHSDHPHGELIFVWHNGQCPKKVLNGHDIKVRSRKGDWISDNLDVGFIEDCLGNALPEFYRFSLPYFSICELRANKSKVRCELLEDLSWHQIHVLQKRLEINGTHVWHRGVNWSTLPSCIYYALIPLNEGINNFDFTMQGPGGSKRTVHFRFNGDGNVHVRSITTLQSTPLTTTGPPTHRRHNFWE